MATTGKTHDSMPLRRLSYQTVKPVPAQTGFMNFTNFFADCGFQALKKNNRQPIG
ncbi:hypothetical protein [Antarctobacter jejuensis]|uniref:hypothetical protein n=1 Tax=Antarctobacter jejuensis TaxID=1439938 RepID=UPI003FD5C4A9